MNRLYSFHYRMKWLIQRDSSIQLYKNHFQSKKQFQLPGNSIHLGISNTMMTVVGIDIDQLDIAQQ